MSKQLTLWDTIKSISSPVSGGGALPPDSQGSPTTSRCGPDRPPVSPSATQASNAEPMTSGTCGPSCEPSSRSADLQLSLENRLQAALALTGSPLYALTWKQRAMQSGPSICALRASARRTFDSDSTGAGWPTSLSLEKDETLEHWKERHQLKRSQGIDLHRWLAIDAQLASWPTPDASEARSGYQRRDTGKAGTQKNLGTVAVDAVGERCHLPTHGPARLTSDGQILTGSSAAMGGGVRLDPAHSRWLMGFPPAWDDCAATATPLSRKSRQRSSEPF
jgi:hypothetical protein